MDDEGRFQTVCWTCSTGHVYEEYEASNTFFREHADEGHEVETVNLEEREPLSLED